MQEEDIKKETAERTSEHQFVATIRINVGQGLSVASKQIEKHLRNMKMKPIKLKLR